MKDAQGYISGKTDRALRKTPGSDNVGYALNVPRTPRRRKVAYSGSYLRFLVNMFALQRKT